MSQKKTSKSKRIPESSSSDKVSYYKAENRSLRKRMEALEKRVLKLEKFAEKSGDKPKKKKEVKAEKQTKEEYKKELVSRFGKEKK